MKRTINFAFTEVDAALEMASYAPMSAVTERIDSAKKKILLELEVNDMREQRLVELVKLASDLIERPVRDSDYHRRVAAFRAGAAYFVGPHDVLEGPIVGPV